MEYEKVLRAMVEKCAQEGVKLAQGRASMGMSLPLNLYYRKCSLLEHGELKLFDEISGIGSDFILASKDPLRTDVPYANYFCWVRDRSLRLDVLCDNLLCAV